MQIRLAAALVGCAVLIPASTQAQAARRDSVGRVGGVVFDSVAKRPATEALIQLVPKDTSVGGTYSTRADGRGRYELRDLRPGSYLLGFYHTGVDTLNLELPPVVVEVRAGERTRADLAVPSPQRIVTAICPGTSGDSIGAVMGFLRDARNDLPANSGSVSVSWNEITIGAGGVRFVPMQSGSQVTQGGSFILCGVPAASEVTLVGAAGSDTSGAVVVRIPDHGLLRRDVAVGGTLNVKGVVLTDAGLPAINAEVRVAGRERLATTDSAGVFRIVSARAGTQTLEARALGFLPARRAVTLTAGRDTSLEFQLTSLKKLMDTIHVVAERVYWADRGGFRRRQRRGFGYFFDDKAIQQRRPYDIFSLLRTIPSVDISRTGFQTSVSLRGPVPLDRKGTTNCLPALHIDGIRFPRDMVGDLDFLVPVNRIAGLEVYTRAGSMPTEFSDFNSCGAIVIWTQPPSPRRRR